MILLIFFAFATFFASTIMHINFAEFSLPFHKACLALLNTENHASEYQTVMCASPKSYLPHIDQLQHSGLGFMLSSAGAHLLFFDWLFGKLNQKNLKLSPLIFCFLLILALMTNFNVVHVRAFLSFWITRMVAKLNLGWTRTQVVTTAGLTSLPFCFTQSSGQGSLLGLLLSWTAAESMALGFGQYTGLELSWSGHRLIRRLLDSLWLQIRLYILLIPSLLTIAHSVPHPISILLVTITFPFLSHLLFIASFSVLIWQPTEMVGNFIWDKFGLVVSSLSNIMPSSFEPCSIPTGVLTAYLVILTAIGWPPRELNNA